MAKLKFHLQNAHYKVRWRAVDFAISVYKEGPRGFTVTVSSRGYGQAFFFNSEENPTLQDLHYYLKVHHRIIKE
jgi:hypothetical protein